MSDDRIKRPSIRKTVFASHFPTLFMVREHDGEGALNRKLEDRKDKTPTLADLRDSGELENHADLVMALTREDPSSTSTFLNTEMDG